MFEPKEEADENLKSIYRGSSDKDNAVSKKERSPRDLEQILEDLSRSERQGDTNLAEDDDLENGEGVLEGREEGDRARQGVIGPKPIKELRLPSSKKTTIPIFLTQFQEEPELVAKNQQIKPEHKPVSSDYKVFAVKKRAALEKAKMEMLSGVHKGVRTAARANSTAEVPISRSTLMKYMAAPPSKQFRAKRGRLPLLTAEQEEQVVVFLRKRCQLGRGLDYSQARDLFQEIFVRLGLGQGRQGQRPERGWVYSFMARNGLVLRGGMN